MSGWPAQGWRAGRTRHRCVALAAALVTVLPVLASSAGATSTQPPPTTTPQAPGIKLLQAPIDLPDPFMLDVKGTYYVYLSSDFDLTQNVPLVVGRPGHWKTSSIDAVPRLPTWAATDPKKGGLSWEPEVYRVGANYLMYFSPTIRYSLPVQHCIALATSTSPAGPFRVEQQPFICQRSLGGDIDAQLFVDPQGPDGPAHPDYLIWKSDNNSTPGDGPPQIWAQPISNDGMHLRGQPVDIYAGDQAWQDGLIEAPQMARAPDGSVWLFFSAGAGFSTPDYGMGVVHCTSPLGPCSGGDSRPLLASNLQGLGPGEETYFTAGDGSHWLLYSPWFTNDPMALIQPVEAARIGWGPFGPYLAAAGSFPPP